MPHFNLMFQCARRLPLSMVCFDRALTVMKGEITNMLDDSTWDVMIAYDGSDDAYIDEILRIAKENKMDSKGLGYVEPEEVLVTQPDEVKGPRGVLLNNAYDRVDADYYVFLENDWWWRDGCIRDGVNVLKVGDGIDMVRMLQYPFKYQAHYDKKEFIVKIGSGPLSGYWDTYGIMRSDMQYQWSFNPHIRRDKFPAGKFPDEERNLWKVEPLYDEMYRELNKHTALLLEEHFVHFGLKNSTGAISNQHYGFFGYTPSDWGSPGFKPMKSKELFDKVIRKSSPPYVTQEKYEMYMELLAEYMGDV